MLLSMCIFSLAAGSRRGVRLCDGYSGVDPNYLLERSFSQFQKDKGCIAAKEKVVHQGIISWRVTVVCPDQHSELSHKLEDATEELNKVTAEASKKMNFDVKMVVVLCPTVGDSLLPSGIDRRLPS